MELFKNIHAIDLALLIDDSLVISDVHIGFEEALNKQGILVPRDHFPQLIKRMEGIFSQVHDVLGNRTKRNKRTDIHNENNETKNNRTLKKIIINGDLKH